MILQAMIVSVLSLIFLLVPSINTAYWILIVLTTQMYLVIYILMFAAALRLRYTRSQVKRAYRIPLKNVGIWIVCSIGILSSVLAIIIGFLPPLEFHTVHTGRYAIGMIVALAFFCLIPSIILLFQKPHWKHKLKHEE